MAKREGYYTRTKYPSRRVEKRIKMPQPTKRPLRFQTRSIIRRELLSKDPYWFTLHRRGPKRPRIGEDPLEARAVPHSIVRGTLPERIMWKFLVERLHFVPDVDFDFQSSLQGGRVDLGGIVADFEFPFLKIILNPLGPTHNEFLRMKKDNEQVMALEEMGYQVYMIPEDAVYEEYGFDELMRKIFGWFHSGGADSVPDIDEQDESNRFFYEDLYRSVLELREEVASIA